MQSEIAKKYKAVGQHWIHADKQLLHGKMVNRSSDDKTVIFPFASLNNNVITNSDNLNTNTGYIDKPEVNMEIRADDGQFFNVQALLDPGSYSIHNDTSSLDENVSIVSYVSEEVANLIANRTKKSKSTTCTCKPAKTCSVTGCFLSTRCIIVTCRLRDSIASTDEMQLSFRVVKTLNDNQAIIGLIDVRRFDLTRRFRHLLK